VARRIAPAPKTAHDDARSRPKFCAAACRKIPDEGAGAAGVGQVGKQQRPAGNKPAAAPECMTDIRVGRTGMGNAPAEPDKG
jgi:hypothetical protein